MTGRKGNAWTARLAGLCALTVMLAAAPAVADDLEGARKADWDLCRTTAEKVERSRELPPALLQAITLVETGRRDPDGEHSPWPWTINSEGRGYYFATKDEAVWAVRRLMADGARSIDVGCMQVNLRYHPRAFTSIEEAFDPLANVSYAALFLENLERRHGDWRAASARYHSYDPTLREKYAARVDNMLARERKALAARLPAGADGDASITTASVSDAADSGSPVKLAELGLRPTLVPGLRRGIDMPETGVTTKDDTASIAAPEKTRVAAR